MPEIGCNDRASERTSGAQDCLHGAWDCSLCCRLDAVALVLHEFVSFLGTCSEVAEVLEPIGEGWYRFHGPLQMKSRAKDGTLLYEVKSDFDSIA